MWNKADYDYIYIYGLIKGGHNGGIGNAGFQGMMTNKLEILVMMTTFQEFLQQGYNHPRVSQQTENRVSKMSFISATNSLFFAFF